MDKVIYQVKCFFQDEEGISAAEYGIFVVFILTIGLLAVSAIGLGIADLAGFNSLP